MARGAADRHKRVAFGDGRRIKWDVNSDIILRFNPNVARPGSEAARDLEWIDFYKGHRKYNRASADRWIWNYDFRPTPGEVFLLPTEYNFGKVAFDSIIIEPCVPSRKLCVENKRWPHERYDEVARQLIDAGHSVLQLVHRDTTHRIPGARQVGCGNIRLALSALAHAELYIGPEGGLHHGAAAMGTPAVVLFGGFVPPQVTGYDMHTNLTGGAEACGSFMKCEHCLAAMRAISVDEVVAAARRYLNGV